jgi:hypothetical protein
VRSAVPTVPATENFQSTSTTAAPKFTPAAPSLPPAAVELCRITPPRHLNSALPARPPCTPASGRHAPGLRSPTLRPPYPHRRSPPGAAPSFNALSQPPSSDALHRCPHPPSRPSSSGACILDHPTAPPPLWLQHQQVSALSLSLSRCYYC